MEKILLLIVCVALNLHTFQCRDKDPLVIAHRGASGYIPEHTLEAKVAAYMMGADYLEQDVVLTKDNVPIVVHDIHLDEVTNVAKIEKFRDRKREDSRYYVIDFTFDEIKELKATERFDYKDPSKPVYSNRFPINKSAFQLYSLREEIELIQGMHKSFYSIYDLDKTKTKKKQPGIYVEIKEPEFHKNSGKADFSEIVLNVLKSYNYTKRSDMAIIQCFDPIELERIKKELKSELILVQLLEDKQVLNGFDWTSKEGLKRIKEFADGIGPEKSQLVNYDQSKNSITPSEFYKNARELGLFMHPYTFRIDKLPDYAKTYDELLKIFIDDLKVEGLFTDFSDLTFDFLESDLNSSVKTKASTSLLFFLAGYFFYFIY